MALKANIAVIRAFLLAPLVPAVVYATGAARSVNDIPMVTLLSGSFTYAATAILALPAYFMITRITPLRAAHVLVLAAAIGAVLMMVVTEKSNVSIFTVGALLGLTGGVAWWALWRGAAQRGVATDGASPRR